MGFEANRAEFSRASEVVQPGYHRLELSDRGVVVELTATNRVGLHRYTFPATANEAKRRMRINPMPANLMLILPEYLITRL